MKLGFARIVVFVVMTHTSFGAARLTSSLYALSNKASAFTVGTVMALFALVPALLAVRAGRWLDRVGPLPPLLVGTTLMTLGALLPVLFPYATADVAPLLVGAALLGTGFMYVQMTVQSLVGSLADPARRPAAFSMLALGFSTSGFIAPVLSGFLIDAVGHRATFAAVFVLLATALGLLLTQRHYLPPHDAPARSTEASDAFELLRHPDVRAVLIVSGLISMGWDMQSFLIPVYGNSVGLAASQIGLILGSFAAATFAIRLAMPALSRRYHEWQVLLFTLLVSAIAFALMPLFSTMLPLMAVAFLLGLGLGSAQPNVMSLLHDRAPHGRVGEALGLRTTIMNSSHVVLPLVIGAFGSVLGTAAGFWMMATGLSGGAWNARQRLRAEQRRTAQ